MKKKFTLFVLAVCLAMVCVIGFTACNITMPVDFEVQFIVDGEVYATIDTAGEETISLPENPQKDGYDFDGWYWDENIWERPFTVNSLLNEKLTSDLRVYAKWKDSESEVQEYVVTFNSMGGSAIESIMVAEGSLLTKPTEPTYTGYIFDGWFKDEELQTEWNFATDTVTEDITLYAKWIDESAATGCEILSAEGFEIDGNKLSIKVSNSQEELSLSEAITVSPYAEWSVSSDITGETEIPSATVSLVVGDNTYYINIVSGNGLHKKQYIVEIRRSAIYTVTYKFNNGDADVTEKVEEDCKAPFKSAEKTGYTFGGWQYNGVDWDIENNFVVSDMTLTAVWSANSYDVTFDSNEGSTIGVSSVTYDSNFEFAVPVRDGYKFNGWKTEDGTLLTNSEGKGLAVWNIVQDTTLFADWSAVEYSITYYNVEGATNPNPVKYTVEDDGITLAEAQRTGYTFLGWYSDDSLITEVEQIETLSAVNVELWAKWEIIEFTATFQNSDGIVEMVTFTVEDKVLDEPKVPERNGYTGAWESYEIATNDLTIDAVYTPIIYTITYTNTKGAENGNETRYTIESDAIRLSDLSAEGYTFDGWYNGGEKVTEIASGTYGDITLEAKWTAIEYTITFIMENEDGGYDGHYADEENPETYTIEDEFMFISPVCDIRGYEFKGWYTQKQGGEKVDKIVKGTTGARVYYAQWQRQEYFIWYHNIEGTIAGNPDSYNVDTETFTLVSPTKRGYKFIGWYSDEEFANPISGTVEQGCIGDLHFYAKWDKEIYSITYILYDGKNNEANPVSYTIEDCIELQSPTKIGYTFGGWFIDSACTEEINKIEGRIGNLTLYAKWYYIGTITFDTNGGSEIAPITQEYGTVLLPPVAPTKDYYEFDGWYSDELLTKKYIFSTMPDRDFTLYAKWTPVVYEITYVLNGGINDSSNPAVYTVESNTITLLPAEKLGYEFIGWFTDAEFTSAVQEKIVQGSHGNITLYANYRINQYTIHFESNGGSAVTAITQNYGTEVVEPAAPSKNGYRFYGWYKNSALTEKYTFTTMPADDITLYAKWSVVTYRINYHLDGGINNVSNPADYTIESEEIIFAAPAKLGYTFLGWYTDSEYETSIDSIVQGSYGEVFVYAKWQAIEYDITYIGIGNAENDNPAKYTIEDTVILAAAEKLGYTFEGWYSDADYRNKVTQITAGTTGDMIFYAKFTPDVYEIWLDGNEGASYTVTFNVNGGSGNIPAQTVTESAALAYPSQIPIKAGHIFAGWYDNADCIGASFDFSDAITADVTLYAKWIAAENTIININDDISIKIVGMTEHAYDFVPLVSGNVTITTTGLADTFGYLYNEQGALLASDDDSGNGGINFQIVYNVTAGEKYTIKVRGYSEKTSGVAVLSIAGNAVPADGGVALETKRVEITFGSEFELPVPAERIGYTFEGWFDVSGMQFTARDGVGLFVWDVAEDTVLYSKWSKVEFTVTFVTNNGSPVETVTLSYGARLDLSQYVTTRNGYTFTGWYLNQTDAEPYNATTMPNANLTLYAKWITYNLNNLKYDETKTAISVNDVLDAALFNAVCFDTDGKQVQVTVTASSELIAGTTITVRLMATSNGKTTTKTITNVKVYGAPTLEYDTGKDYFDLSDTLDAELFSANGLDSFNEATEIRVFVEEEDYAAGDLVTIVIQSIDPAGNITEQKIQNVKVYGLPEISYDQTVTGIKESDTIGAELFGVTGAVDSFGEPLDVTATLYNGTQEAGNIITVRLSAEDSKGNVCIIDLSIKVYGAPTINFPTNTDIKLGSEITAELLGLSGFDSHGGEVSFSLSTEDVQAAGEIMTYTATAADYLGNTATKSFSVKIYGQPTFSCLAGVNYNETLSASTLQAMARDSFGKGLDVSVQLISGTMSAGTKITVRLSATDASGTEWYVEKQIGVYDPEDIYLNYSAGMTDSIKLTSRGKEFDASATDSFGEACALSVRRADGGDLIAGQIQDIVIIATDKAGNTKSSEIISGIKVYDMPTVELTDPGNGYIVQEGTDISFLFIVKDSFDQELYAEVTANSALVAGEIVCITVRATDSAGNVREETFEFGVLPSDSAFVRLFVDGKLWKSEFVTDNSISVPAIPQGMSFYGWMNKSNIRYTDGEGNLLQDLTTIEYIELHAVYYLEGYTPILTANELKNIQMDGKYVLVYDIDLGGAEWTPLGTEKSPFSGEFNGNGLTISNIKITKDIQYVGLFGYNVGTIKNLKIENFQFDVESRHYSVCVSGLAGYKDGIITNSYANINGNIIFLAYSATRAHCIGGLTGYNNGTVRNSYAMSEVNIEYSYYSGEYYSVGGLVGENTGTIISCYAMGNVSSSSNAFAGGLVGLNSGTIVNSYATGSVSSGRYVGGLVGMNRATIMNCYATGDASTTILTRSEDLVYGYGSVGGLVGYNEQIIKNSYATGSVSSRSYAGGLVGFTRAGRITNCYATGNVSASASSSQYYVSAGGLIGYNYNNGIITNCYRYNRQIVSVKGVKNTLGTATSMSNFFSKDWCQDTLGWLEILLWNFNGSYPTLNFEKYLISTAEELMSLQGAELTFNYELVSNINLGGMEWTPIAELLWMSEFDGNGFTISNFKITTASDGYLGFFGQNSGVIKNLCVKNFTIDAEGDSNVYAGGVAGQNEGTITDCGATGNVCVTSSDGSSCAGGLVGNNSGCITKCYATGDVNATSSPASSQTGGLVGYNNQGTITDCYATGDVNSTSFNNSSYAGGLVGYNNKGMITNCYAIGDVSANSTSLKACVGGLVGDNGGSIANSYRYSGQTFTAIKGDSTSNEPTNTLGTATDLATLQSVSFHTDTLGWSTDDWAFVEGSFPTLKDAGTTATIYEK